MTRWRYEVEAGVDSGVMVVVKGALDFQLLLQVALKLPVDVVHHRLIAAGHTCGVASDLSFMKGTLLTLPTYAESAYLHPSPRTLKPLTGEIDHFNHHREMLRWHSCEWLLTHTPNALAHPDDRPVCNATPPKAQGM